MRFATGLIIEFLGGGLFGTLIMALCVAAKQDKTE